MADEDPGKRVVVYQLVAGLLALMLVGNLAMSWWVEHHTAHPFGAPDATWTVDVPARVARANQGFSEMTEVQETYAVVGDVYVGTHFMGPRQLSPLHIHPVSDEIAIPATGPAEAWWRSAGPADELVETHRELPTGSAAISPARTPHAFRNVGSDGFLAALTFQRPVPGGNLYVLPDDPGVSRAAAPTILEPGDATTPGLTPLHALDGAAWQAVVDDTWTLPITSGHPIVFFVAAGRGALDGRPLAPGTLAHVAQGAPAEVVATERIVAWVVDPGGLLR